MYFFSHLHEETSKPRLTFITLQSARSLGRLSPDPGAGEAPALHRGAGSPVASCTLLVAAYGSSWVGPGPSAVGEWGLSHRTSGEVPGVL